MTLEQFFTEHTKAAIAFSGGTDSAYLLHTAKRCGAQIGAYYVKTPFQPQFELDDALQLARQLEVPLTVLTVNALEDPCIRENPPRRCYFCKKAIFSAILQRAKEDGFILVLDGTNASDDAADRPGMHALRELNIRSPLRECGLTKAQIRKLSKAAGLFTHDKPAYACLATRIPTGTTITEELLAVTEQNEAYLQSLGFRDFRIRLMGRSAKLELTEDNLPLLIQHRQAILLKLKQDYTDVLLDLEVRE